ncbi:MAG: hypothetical protein M0Z84_14780, partial [Gammaproteobacteria bacterium]|nr:hypothetical protein [Gammaproteobacteria bacterium]
MNNEGPFSDEYLNAFVDDQLALDEKGRLYSEISKDEAMNRRVCELRKVRDLVQMAYKNPPEAPSGSPTRTQDRARLRRRFIAGVAAIVGVLTLMSGLPQDSASIGLPGGGAALALERPAADSNPAPARQVVASAATRGGQVIKVLFHLNSGNPTHMKEVLNETRNLLNLYRRTHQKARVEVITNGEGLNLLLAARSPYPALVTSMLKQYKNLQFAACLNTLNR